MRKSTPRLPRASDHLRLQGWTGALAWLCFAQALAAEPLSLSFSPATKKNAGGTVVWEVPLASGSNMAIKAASNVLAQTKAVTLMWKGFQGTDQVWNMPPPGPASAQLGAGGEASVPISFAKGSYKQWQVTACVNWQPPGHDHKSDDCVTAFVEGIDLVAMNAGKLIKIVSPSHAGLPHNWEKLSRYGNSIGVSVQDEVLSKSPGKLVTLKYDSHDLASNKKAWPKPVDKISPKSLSLSGATSQGGWAQMSAPLVLPPETGEWLTIRACLTVEVSGEICSDAYAYRLTEPPLKAVIDKNPVIDSNQPLPPVSPPPSGGGGGGGGGKANLMAPPPVLGAPAAGSPMPATSAPPGRPAPALSAPAPQMAPVNPGLSTLPQVPGCTAVPGRSGEYSCATPDAAAGCERLRASPTSGIRACHGGGARLRR